MEKLLLRPMEAAHLISVSRSKIYSMLDSGEIPSVRWGRCVRVPVNALRQLISDRQHDSSTK
ncbi:MAG: helix-turn-helix domain-containing protein [Chloroflexi bacterium]|nr:helix-turn-helix domain-containing protein [Chloroflexota bacterium]